MFYPFTLVAFLGDETQIGNRFHKIMFKLHVMSKVLFLLFFKIVTPVIRCQRLQFSSKDSGETVQYTASH